MRNAFPMPTRTMRRLDRLHRSYRLQWIHATYRLATGYVGGPPKRRRR